MDEETAVFTVDMVWEVPELPDVTALLETAVRAALVQQQVPPPAGVTLVMGDDALLHEMNRTYRQIDAPTDVLSFTADETMQEPGGAPYLGDILMSIPYAQRQADAEGHRLTAELQLLAVHGVLHLLGHDHMDPADKAVMWAAQTAVLQQLGIHITIPYDEAG